MTVSGAAAAARRNQVPLGIAYMVGATVMFAGGNAVVKWELATYPLGEVAFGRTLFAFLTVAAIVLPRAGWGVLRTQRYREHLQRGLSQLGSMLLWFLAVSVLSLGSATAIGFAAPLFTTLLSIVILKEKVGIHRWSALIVGFVGVLIITHPGAGTLTYGALFALGNAVLISTVAIAIRRMSITESAETLTLYQMSIMTLCTAGLLTLGFRGPHWADALIVALAGVGNGIAQFWWTRSLSLAPPSAVVPFTTCRWYGQRSSASRCGGTCRPRACWSVPRSLSPRAFTSCGARPYAADARRSQRRGARSPA
jgi:drug/metabolite transporter (DMT)-like permease